MIRPSLTRPPESITFLASLPSAVPALTAARSMSPVEIWGIAYFWQMKVALGPLPAPGAPNRISFMGYPLKIKNQARSPAGLMHPIADAPAPGLRVYRRQGRARAL